MSWNFHVGQKVVCVDDGPSRIETPLKLDLVKGHIYTIAAITSKFSKLSVQCAEFQHAYADDDGIRIFWMHADRFRPLRTRETSIEIFRSLLTPSKAKEEV